MELLICLFLLINSAIALFTYRVLHRVRYLFSERFGFIVALTGSNIVALVVTTNLFSLFPNHPTIISCLNIVVGASVGLAFGSLISSQTLIAGVYSGVTGAIMGTMIGAIAKDPSICGIPSQIYTENEYLLFFGVFGIILHFITASLLYFALRV